MNNDFRSIENKYRRSTIPPVAPYELDEAARQEYAHKLRIQRQVEHIILSAGERYFGATIDSYRATTPDQQKIVHAVKKYTATLATHRNACEGIVFYGPVGTGKDHLAYTVAMSAAAQGLQVQWVRCRDWFGRIRDAMGSDRKEASIIAELVKPDLVVLSDPLPPFGALTQHQADMLYQALEGRYSRNLFSITTLNVEGDEEADERMGAGVWDRLCHGALLLQCNWPSYRTPKRRIETGR
jgi:DNA replication protein DnaC